ncbi:MAG: TrmH family RNA methyltransferase [Actinobacteria bacterium]|nr:TrmH family RNA methyltransferase [Actinomycetota bacterium]
MPHSPTPASVALARRNPALVVLEGFHAVKHALRFGARLEGLVTPDREALAALCADLAPDVAGALAGAADVDAATFAAMAPFPIPTPVLAIARRPGVEVARLLAGPGRIVLLDWPRNLGNIGAVVRVAAAAGIAGVLTTGDRDPWDSAALRGSAGLHFAVPVVRIDSLPPGDRPLVALHPEGEPLGRTPIPNDAVLAFGSERQGLDRALLDRAALRLAIPMRPGVSSLNLATSVAVVVYS